MIHLFLALTALFLLGCGETESNVRMRGQSAHYQSAIETDDILVDGELIPAPVQEPSTPPPATPPQTPDPVVTITPGPAPVDFAASLTGQKAGGIINVDLVLDDSVVEELKADAFAVQGAAIEEINGEGNKYALVLRAAAPGDVEVQLPAGKLTSAKTGKKNLASEKVKIRVTAEDLYGPEQAARFQIQSLALYAPSRLVIVVDDSSSMGDDQEVLSTAMTTALNNLYGRDVEIYLYTTTQWGTGVVNTQSSLMNAGTSIFPNYTGSYATGLGKKTAGRYLSSMVANPGNYFNGSKAPALFRMTEFSGANGSVQWTPDMIFTQDYDTIDEKFVIAKSAFQTGDVSEIGSRILSKDMTREQFDQAVQNMADDLKALGDKGASRGELPLCTMATMLMNEGPHAIFNDKRKTAFLVLTDEDQSNLSCLYKFQSKQVYLPQTVVYPHYTYQRTYLYYERRCDSGGDQFCTATHSYRIQRCIENGVNTCATTNRDCTAAESQVARDKFMAVNKASFDAGTFRFPENNKCLQRVTYVSRNFGSLQYADGSRISNIYVRPGQACDAPSFDRWDPNTSQYVTENRSILDFYRAQEPSLVIKGCYESPYQHTQTSWKMESYPGADQHDDIGGFVKAKADEVLGRENYTIALIGNLGAENPEGCEAKASHRSSMIESIADYKQSVCSESYVPALNWFEKFVKFEVVDTYPISDNAKRLGEVRVVDGRILTEEEDYLLVDGAIVFKPGAIQAGEYVSIVWYSN